MLLRSTRVRAKFGGFHISTHIPAKNAPDFTLPNKDAPKTCPILDPNPWRRTFRGVCFCAPTRVRAKSNGFHISAPEYVKNPPDFTHPNRDTPKPHPVLGANSCRRTFRGVCFCALHGYVQNPTGFGLCHSTWRKTRRVLDFATRHGTKPGGVWTLPHDMVRNPAGFGLCHST